MSNYFLLLFKKKLIIIELHENIFNYPYFYTNVVYFLL